MPRWSRQDGGASVTELVALAVVMSLAVAALPAIGGPVRDAVIGAVSAAANPAAVPADGGSGQAPAQPVTVPVGDAGRSDDPDLLSAALDGPEGVQMLGLGTQESTYPMLLASLEGTGALAGFGEPALGVGGDLDVGERLMALDGLDLGVSALGPDPATLADGDPPALLAQLTTGPAAVSGTLSEAEADFARYEVWFRQQFDRSPFDGQPLSPQEALAAEVKLNELGLVDTDPTAAASSPTPPRGADPAWNGFPEWLRLTPAAEDTLQRAIDNRDLGELIDPGRVVTTAGGLPLSFVTKSFTDSLARARGSLVVGAPLSVALSTLRSDQLFEHEGVDLAARLGGSVGLAGLGNMAGRQLDSVYQMTDTIKFGSSRDLAAMWTAGQIFLGEEVVIPALRDADLLSTAPPLGADGTPEWDSLGQWLGYYGPEALNRGLAAVPLTIDAIADPKKNARQAAFTAGLTFALPTGYSLLRNAVVDPPPGEVGERVTNAATHVTNEIEQYRSFWERLTEHPHSFDNPWVRVGLGVPVQATLGASEIAGDIMTGLTQPRGLVDPSEGLDLSLADEESQREASRRFAMANDLIRSTGPAGEATADFLTGTQQALGGAWDATTTALGNVNRNVMRGAEIILTGQMQWDGDRAAVPFQVRRDPTTGELVRVEQPVEGAELPGRLTNAIYDYAQGVALGFQDLRNPETGPCDDPSMRCWGRFAGELIVGDGTAGTPPQCTSAAQTGCVIPGTRDPNNPNSVGQLRVGAPSAGAPSAGAPAAGGRPECTSAAQTGCVIPGTRDPNNPNSVGQLRVGAPSAGPALPGSPGYAACVARGECGDQSAPGSRGYGQGPNGVGIIGSEVGPRLVGPEIVGPGRTYIPGQQQLIDTANQVRSTVYDGVVEPTRNTIRRATDAGQRSLERINNQGLPGAAGVLRDGWNCVTRPVACLQGPQSNLLTGDGVLLAADPTIISDTPADFVITDPHPAAITPDLDLSGLAPPAATTDFNPPAVTAPVDEGHLAFQPDQPGDTHWQDYQFTPDAPTVTPFTVDDLDPTTRNGSGDLTFDTIDLGIDLTPPATTGLGATAVNPGTLTFDPAVDFSALTATNRTFDTAGLSFDTGTDLGVTFDTFDLGVDTTLDFDSEFTFSNSIG